MNTDWDWDSPTIACAVVRESGTRNLFAGHALLRRLSGGPVPDNGPMGTIACYASREYERVVDAQYLDQIRTQAKQFSNKLLSRRSGVAKCAIMNFKKGKNTIKPRTLRK